MRRNKPDATGKHPWKAEVTGGGATPSSGTTCGKYYQRRAKTRRGRIYKYW